MIAVDLTAEQAEVLRRCAPGQRVDGGAWDAARDARLYQPLVHDGLLSRTVSPWEPDQKYEVVTYETTAIGQWALDTHDRQLKADLTAMRESLAASPATPDSFAIRVDDEVVLVAGACIAEFEEATTCGVRLACGGVCWLDKKHMGPHLCRGDEYGPGTCTADVHLRDQAGP